MTGMSARRFTAYLERQGFDAVTRSRGGFVHPGCSQCPTEIIAGVACHTGRCPKLNPASSGELARCEALDAIRYKARRNHWPEGISVRAMAWLSAAGVAS